MAKFCSECGAPLGENVKFCAECGAPVLRTQTEVQKNVPENKTAAFAAEKAMKKENTVQNVVPVKKKGKSFLSLFLVIVMLAELGIAGFKYPGWFTKKSGGGDGKAEAAAFDAETLSAKTPSGVSVELTEYTYSPDCELTVTPLKKITDENGDYEITPYDVSIGETHTPDDFVTVRIPFDGSFCDKGEDPAGCVGAVYFNENTGEWEDVLYTVDKENSELVITTDHFSEYGAFKVKNSGLRNAYLTDNDLFIPELTDTDKALSVMSSYVESSGEDTKLAKLMGSETVMAALSLTGAVSDTADAVGNVFSVATYLDGIDLAMKGDWNSLQIFDRVNTEFIKSKPPAKELFYNNGFAAKTSDVLSKVGLAVSSVKLLYAFGQAAAGNASYADKLNLYKDSINLAISLSGNATLGALMLPVFIADKFINTLFTEAFEIKDAQLEEEYEYFNRKFEGSSEPYLRPGRGAKDWRRVIIELIRDNPDADADKLIEEEIDTFAEDFWRLDAEELAWFSSSLPKNVKRIPDTTQSEREAITKAYKAQLYKELVPVMQSVRLYFEQKAELEVKKEVAAAKKLYNSRINIRVTEALPEGAASQYAGCKVRFMPLSTLADKNSWTFTLNENGSVSACCTYLGYLQAGCPYAVCVYGKKDDPDSADPILTVDTGLDSGSIGVILERSEEEPAASVPADSPFPLETDLYIKRSSGVIYKSGNYVYKGKKAHLSVDENGSFRLTFPPLSGEEFTWDSGSAAYFHTGLSADGFTVTGKIDPTAYGHMLYSDHIYDTALEVSPAAVSFTGSLSVETNWGGGDIRTTGPSAESGTFTHRPESAGDALLIRYDLSSGQIEADLELRGSYTAVVDGKTKEDNTSWLIELDMTSEEPK